MAKDDTQIELASLRAQLSKQIEIADRIGEPLLSALLCDAEAYIEKLLQR